MTLHELEKKLIELDDLRAELKSVIEEVKGDLNPTPPHPTWEPKPDENYYMLSTDGAPYCWRWLGDYDKETYKYKIGNVFRTKAEAEFTAERLKVLGEMRKWAGNSYDGAYIYYHRSTDQILTSWDCVHYHGDIRFKNTDDAENCIKAVGEDRIKKYYFMIPEN